MTAKELLVGAALVSGAAFAAALGTSSASLAQGYYGPNYGYSYRYRYGGGPYYDYYQGDPGVYDNYGPSVPNILRGGPGPRVGGGGGMGIGAVR